MDDQGVGKRVAAARKMAGIDQKELARRIDTPKLGFKNIGKIERGQRRLEPHEAPLFAAALGVDTDFFFQDPAAAPDATAYLHLVRNEFRVDVDRMHAELAHVHVRLGHLEVLVSQTFTELFTLLRQVAEGLGTVEPASGPAEAGVLPLAELEGLDLPASVPRHAQGSSPTANTGASEDAPPPRQRRKSA